MEWENYESDEYLPDERIFENIPGVAENNERFWFPKLIEDTLETGWLINIQGTSEADASGNSSRSAIKLYFLKENGEGFSVYMFYQPYFFVVCKVTLFSNILKPGYEIQVEEFIRKSFKIVLHSKIVEKEDLSLPNHLLGKRRKLLQLLFRNCHDLLLVRKFIKNAVAKNCTREEAANTYLNSFKYLRSY